MNRAGSFQKEMLIVGMLSTDREMKDEAKRRLEELDGGCRYAGPSLPFTYTDYYDAEMGEGIERDFLAFETLVDPSLLAEFKLDTNRLEERFVVGGGRRVNLDPGLLSLGKLILASTKDNAQRIPLRDGIYAEVTLIYREKSYRPLPWTYPDYRSPEYLEILHALREELREKLQGEA